MAADLGAYDWLASEPGPKMLLEALKLYGTTEKAGPGDNPVILGWAQALGIRAYNADSIAWCGLFVATCAKRAGKPIPLIPLRARAWATWGEPSRVPSLGDVLVFERDGGGHVGLYVGEDATHFHVLGGNQSDAVNIKRIERSRFLAARRHYAIAPPANVRPIHLAAAGAVSEKES